MRRSRTNLPPAFTLIELLVVVAIMGIILTICVPFMHSTLTRRRGMNGAVRDVQAVCKVARDWAILQQHAQVLSIHPKEGVFEVGAGSSAVTEGERLFSPDVSGGEWRMVDNRPPPLSAPSNANKLTSEDSRIQLPNGVVVEGLGVNGEDWTDDPVAQVGFRPNGTSDEMSVVLYCGETGERRNIWLEVVTGLAELESDPSKFKAR